MEIPEELIADMIPAVKEQLECKDLPFVKQVFDRLTTKESFEEEEAFELLAQALAIAVNKMMTSGKPFDGAYYKELLANLPELPNEG